MEFKIFLILSVSVFALDNGLGKTPPLGFNTWNHFYCGINEDIIKHTADSLVSLGLKDLGYNYVNIDDCWMAKNRSKDGRLVPDPKRFSHGIKALADYVHSKGLKLGIYSSAGNMTCQKFPASEGHEDIDAKTWAEWGIDYLKYDNCYHSNASAKVRYTKMRNALNKTGRPIFYSICNWGGEKVWEWGASVGNSWRTTGDISDKFPSMRAIYSRNIVLYKYGHPGGWNDPDMLEVGNGKMKTIEYKTHFILWAMAKSPLLIGCDLTRVSKADLAILKNKQMIGVNQDKLGVQAKCVLNCKAEDFSKDAKNPQFGIMPLSTGDYVLSITDWSDLKSFGNIIVDFPKLGLTGKKYKVLDLWNNKEVGTFTERFILKMLPMHDTAVFKLTKLA